MDNKAKEARREKMLTQPLLPLLIRMAVPTMTGMLVMVIYSLTDTFFIGQLGSAAMTASIGIVFSFISLVQAVGFWFGYGSGNVMSGKLGEKDDREAEIISSDGVLLSIIAGILIMLPGLFFTQPLAVKLGGNASEDLLAYTVSYLRIIVFAVPFSLFSTTVYNQLRLCGNVRDAMAGYMSGMLLNMILDPVFILVFKMGIAGAGLATALGQVLSAVLLCLLSYRHGNIPVTIKKARFNRKRLYSILAGGAPNFSRQGITSIAGVLLNLAAARYGEVMIAALTVAARASAIGYMLAIGFGQGFQPICAMNYGARQYDRVKKAFRMTLAAGTGILTVFTVICFLCAGQIAGLLSSSPEVTGLAARILRFQCVSLPFLGFYAFSSMYMQNVGQYLKALLISVMRQGLFYLPLLFILPAVLGETGLCILQPAADLFSLAGAAFILKNAKIYPEKTV